MSAQRLASFRRCAIYEEPSWRCCCSPHSCSPHAVRRAPTAATRSRHRACCESAPKACTPRSAITTRRPASSSAMTSTLLDAVADKLGVKVEFVETPWDAIFAALEANRFDVVANEVTINAERKEKYDLSEPYSVGEGVIVTRADDNSVKSLDDIKGKVAGENGHQQLGAGRPRSRCARRGRRGLHPGHQAAQPGPGRSGDQRQHRGVRLPCRDRRHLGEDRRQRQARRASRASPPGRTAGCCLT